MEETGETDGISSFDIISQAWTLILLMISGGHSKIINEKLHHAGVVIVRIAHLRLCLVSGVKDCPVGTIASVILLTFGVCQYILSGIRKFASTVETAVEAQYCSMMFSQVIDSLRTIFALIVPRASLLHVHSRDTSTIPLV